MNKDTIMKLLQSPNTEDFELGLNYAYKSMDKLQFEEAMKECLDTINKDITVDRQFIFEAYGICYKRANNNVWRTSQDKEQCINIGYREIKLE